jgi:hypothetical protein
MTDDKGMFALALVQGRARRISHVDGAEEELENEAG